MDDVAAVLFDFSGTLFRLEEDDSWFAGMEIGRRRNAYVVTLFGPAGRSAFAHY